MNINIDYNFKEISGPYLVLVAPIEDDAFGVDL